MYSFRNVITKKSLISALVVGALLLSYYFFISSEIRMSQLENNLILFEIGSCFVLTLIHFKIPEKYRYYFNFFYIIFLSIFTVLTLDFLNGTFEHPFEDTLNNVNLKFFVSFLVVYLLYILFVSLFKNMRRACSIGFVIFILIGLIGYVIYEFRGDRLLFADLLAVETALDVSGSYNIIPVKDILYQGIISIFCGIVILTQIYKVKTPFTSTKRLVCYLIFAFGIYGLYHTSFNNFFYSWSEVENSYVYSFFSNLKFMEVQPQRSYDKNEVIEMIEDSNEANILPMSYDPEEEIEERFPEYVEKYDTTNPNIIVVMNESFTDIDIFGETKTNSKVFTGINKMTNVIEGYTYVGIRGGGTADSEYEFLTGNSTMILPLNARPYQFYVNEGSENLVTYLDSLGYSTMAIHPGNPLSWNRAAVYQIQFGFDEVIFADQFTFEEYKRNPGFKTDIATYNKIFEKFNEDHISPFFIFDVTIQNHGGYKLGYDNLEKISLDKQYNPEIEEFLSLMKSSDADFSTLVNFFNNFDEPTVILMFGDHQPKFTTDFPSYSKDKDLTIEELQSLYQTPYIIAANYPLPVQQNLDLSVNYLSTLLLECAGLEKPPINNYLANMYKNIKAINRYGIVTQDGEAYSYDEIPNRYKDLITEFKNFSYYNILEQKMTDFDY